MTIDEAIKKHKKLKILAKGTNDKRGAFYSAEEHEQLAEWLEELKKYKENEFNVLKEDGQLLYKQGILDGYNKAIDDFVNNCSEYYFTVDDSPFMPYLRDINIISQPNIERIAEQLKAGGENERM